MYPAALQADESQYAIRFLQRITLLNPMAGCMQQCIADTGPHPAMMPGQDVLQRSQVAVQADILVGAGDPAKGDLVRCQPDQ